MQGNTIRVTVQNIGGISDHSVSLAPGINVLAGQNATNRTSFLKALAAVQGSEEVSLKGDASNGTVELTFNGEDYCRTVRRAGDGLIFEGEVPVPEEQRGVAELFAFLFERNRAREAIRQGNDLRSVVMEPVDTTQIQQEIEKLKQRRTELESELTELRSLKRSLPSLQQRRNELSEDIDRLESAISEKQAEIEAAETTIGEGQAAKEEIKSKNKEIRSKQSDLDRVTSRIESTVNTIAQLENDLEQAQSELSGIETTSETSLPAIKSDLSELHNQVATKETMMSELQNIIQFNKDFIETETTGGNAASILSSVQNISEPRMTAERLVSDEGEITCWTCGSTTSQSQISEMVEQLQGIHEDLYGEREQLRQRLKEKQAQKETIEETKERQATLEDSIADIESQLSKHRSSLDKLERREQRLSSDISELESEVASLQQDREDRILELHQELNSLERELEETTAQQASVRDEIEAAERETDDIESIESQLAELTTQTTDLRERVERLEREAVDSFNEHMETVLNILAYENIERIWIERREANEKDGRQNRRATQFKLHVIRESEDGRAYEDSITHLSESEREVTGLIFALAGYLVHEVYETVPFMILDSLEAIDSDRIALLVDYLSDYAENIVIALLDADASVLPEQYHYVR